ncbi:uncharacterized protein [Amphiura filiformis]|uniref:uncharacterized protein n=1 Tax=Amphiura filiformis TaxID=82378 RepID=UPI003B20BB26
MGEPGEQPDLLAAALSQSGFSLDDILNPDLEEDDVVEVTDPGSLLAQAMAQSGVGNEPDPLLELLNPSSSASQFTYTPQSTHSTPASVSGNPLVTMRHVPASVAAAASPVATTKPAVVRLQYTGSQENVKGQQIIRVMPSRTVPNMTPTSPFVNARAVTASASGSSAATSQSGLHGRVVSMGSPTIRMAIRSNTGVTAARRTTQGIPAIVHTSTGSKQITIPLPTTATSSISSVIVRL